jgi:hypothetical protein
MSCAITVNEEYVSYLISLLKRYHAYATEKLLMSKLISGRRYTLTLSQLKKISDIIFYLYYWDENYDCQLVHQAKEQAMSILNFTENMIDGFSVYDAILTENGYVYLNESGTIYTELE